MSISLEERLAQYGPVLDAATADDLGDRSHGTTSDLARPRRLRPVVVAVVVVALAGIAAIAIAASGSRTRGSGQLREPPTIPDEQVPSPLFGNVEQLTPRSLPDGWSRCSGGRATHPGATEDWWSQTFGPFNADGCRPLITVTQIPLGQGSFVAWSAAEDAKIAGDADATRWSNPDAGSVSLFTWAFDQNLLVEGCCGPDAVAHLDDVAGAALIATRTQAPSRCTNPSSDLSSETLTENLTAKTSRMFDGYGCPLRADIARMQTLPETDHCWPGLTFLVIGTPTGASINDSEPRTYVRDPTGQLSGGVPDPALDLDATLGDNATRGGYVREGRTVWIDEDDDSTVFVVSGDTTEVWPRHDKGLACA
jgi:hypothetical protein